MGGPERLFAESLLAQSQSGPRVKPTTSPDEARRVADDLESLFLAEMLRHMFTGIRTDGMFGGGNAESIYRSMMMDEYGKVIARAGGIGIADAVYREILTLQESEQR